ncbi:MAG: TetR/AcrR family transcriptional regulator [Bryobacteraceae bacterium]|nr:TetR/AcrR family transcriptional regulator [Bryobacteraceae bacterium]
MRLFWRNGFDGTSINDLAEAMNINPPSLYSAFGDKRSLFAEAVQAYLAGPGQCAAQALEATTAREAVEQLLAGAVQTFTQPSCPTGCMVVLAATCCSPESLDIAATLATQRRYFEQAIHVRLRRGQDNGEVPSDVNVESLAAYVVIVYQGLALAARDGSSREDLQQVLKHVMQAWPGAA